jgi:hypothetical protein
MPALHLIQNQTDPKLLPRPERPGTDMWISGYWSLADATVESLVGGRNSGIRNPSNLRQQTLLHA